LQAADARTAPAACSFSGVEDVEKGVDAELHVVPAGIDVPKARRQRTARQERAEGEEPAGGGEVGAADVATAASCRARFSRLDDAILDPCGSVAFLGARTPRE
jgi:hypothetical protein